MRIGIDASRGFEPELTGTERYTFELVRRLVDKKALQKHEIYLYVRPNFLISNFDFLTKIKHKNLKIIKINLPRLWTQVGLAFRTWRDGLDVLWVPAHTLPVLRRIGIKTVVTIHGIEYEWLPAFENKLQRWYLPWSTMYAVKTASKVIAVSEFTKRQLIDRLGAKGEKIRVIHEGAMDNIKYQVSSIKQREVLEKYGLQPQKYLIFVGTVQPRKNLERLVEAMQILNIKYQISNIKLVIVGKLGWGYKALLHKYQISNIKYQIVFTGYVSDAERQALLENARLYVQPSITEGFGLPIVEAWRAGVPVVSSRGGALAEIIGDAGVLFDPLRVEEMGEALARVWQEKKLRQVLIKKGKERLTQFSWDRAARETLRVLTSEDVL